MTFSTAWAHHSPDDVMQQQPQARQPEGQQHDIIVEATLRPSAAQTWVSSSHSLQTRRSLSAPQDQEVTYDSYSILSNLSSTENHTVSHYGGDAFLGHAASGQQQQTSAFTRSSTMSSVVSQPLSTESAIMDSAYESMDPHAVRELVSRNSLAHS